MYTEFFEFSFHGVFSTPWLSILKLNFTESQLSV